MHGDTKKSGALGGLLVMADGWGFEPVSAFTPRLHATGTGEAGHGDLLRLRQGQRHLGKDLLACGLLHLSVLGSSVLRAGGVALDLALLEGASGFFAAMEVLNVNRALARSSASLSIRMSEGSERLSRISGEQIFIGRCKGALEVLVVALAEERSVDAQHNRELRGVDVRDHGVLLPGLGQATCCRCRAPTPAAPAAPQGTHLQTFSVSLGDAVISKDNIPHFSLICNQPLVELPALRLVRAFAEGLHVDGEPLVGLELQVLVCVLQVHSGLAHLRELFEASLHIGEATNTDVLVALVVDDGVGLDVVQAPKGAASSMASISRTCRPLECFLDSLESAPEAEMAAAVAGWDASLA